ncbi:MAG: RdgB/HAM1 family non-canonical purine NTP pyrophosphatase [Acidimicrobiales bacterium]
MALELVSATTNPHKLLEIEAILGTAVVLLPRPSHIPDVVEDAPTLAGNARLKAGTICQALGSAAVADDTGLEVDALSGAPGVHTARYAGPNAADADNIAKLLDELANAAFAARTARFRTVAVVVWPDRSELLAEGVVEGHIRQRPSGTGGFGYDPVFEPDEAPGLTFAEMSDQAKNRISHRGRAFRELLVGLRARP